MKEIAWQALTIKEVLAKLNSSATGLTSQEVARRAKRYGRNEITPVSATNRSISIFLSQFKSPLVYILLIAALVTFYLKATFDALVIVGVLIANALIGFFQEWKAEMGLAALRQLINPQARTMRDGRIILIPTTGLVPGDVIELMQGDHVPADLRLIEAIGLKIDEAVLSGESVPVEKFTHPTQEQSTKDRSGSIAYKGTTVAVGRALGVVIAIGEKTQFGQLALTTGRTVAEPTPLSRNIASLSHSLLIVIGVLVGIITVLGLTQGKGLAEMFFLAVATAIAAIPEGLPAVITIALAVGVIRMAQRRAIVRQLAAVETLSTINTIVSDKTGTLTENKLVIREIHLPDSESITVTGSGYVPEGKFIQAEKSISSKLKEQLVGMLEVGMLANDAQLVPTNSHWRVIGDPTEGSILVAGKKIGINITELKKHWPRFGEIPFDSARRFMATAHYTGHKNLIVAVKGSVSTIINRSNCYLDTSGKVHPLSYNKKQEFSNLAKTVASSGYRLIALAKTEFPSKAKFSDKTLPKLTYLGFLAMIDAPRASALRAVQAFQEAGIRVMMVTGDAAETAQVVGELMGIRNGDLRVITQAQILRMNELEFEEVVASHNIFAEISPLVKLKIVTVLQAQGAIVAVTGDGANDAPILKKAHVGIAMGEGGTDVAQAAAGIVLADNNFATILGAIEEGRVIFANIRRCLWYLLSTNAAELLILLFSLMATWPIPFLPVHLLWINVITDGTATIGLAIEPKHHNFIHDQPRSPQEPLINQLAAKRIILVAILTTMAVLVFYYLKISHGGDLAYARSMAFAVIVLFQIINIFNARSLSLSITKLPLANNPFLIISTILSLMLMVATIELPVLQGVFKTVSLGLNDWLWSFLGAMGVIVVVEIHKLAIKLRSGGLRWL